MHLLRTNVTEFMQTTNKHAFITLTYKEMNMHQLWGYLNHCYCILYLFNGALMYRT